MDLKPFPEKPEELFRVENGSVFYRTRSASKDAPILVLDEATAFTDPEQELIQQALSVNLHRGKTLIVIAHRISTVRNFDKIGSRDRNIVAEGTHTDPGSRDLSMHVGSTYSAMELMKWAESVA